MIDVARVSFKVHISSVNSIVFRKKTDIGELDLNDAWKITALHCLCVLSFPHKSYHQLLQVPFMGTFPFGCDWQPDIIKRSIQTLPAGM